MTTTDKMAAWSRHHRSLPNDLYTSDIDAVLIQSGRLLEGIWMSFYDRHPFLLYDLADSAPDRHIRRAAMVDLADRAGLPAITIDWRERNGKVEYGVIARNVRGLAVLGDKQRIMMREEFISWHYKLRGTGPQAAAKRVENSDWRDDLGSRFRRWEPENLSACAGEAVSVVALMELKKRDYAPFDHSSAQVMALSDLAARAGLSCIAGGYQHQATVEATDEAQGWTERWDFTHADGQQQTEREFVAELWRLRGEELPADISSILAGPRRRVR